MNHRGTITALVVGVALAATPALAQHGGMMGDHGSMQAGNMAGHMNAMLDHMTQMMQQMQQLEHMNGQQTQQTGATAKSAATGSPAACSPAMNAMTGRMQVQMAVMMPRMQGIISELRTYLDQNKDGGPAGDQATMQSLMTGMDDMVTAGDRIMQTLHGGMGGGVNGMNGMAGSTNGNGHADTHANGKAGDHHTADGQ